MAVPKRKTSKMKKRQRKAANRYQGIIGGVCHVCEAPVLPHKVCKSCGSYNGKQIISIEE